MPEYPRFTLNRGMVMLRYKQPFFDWLKIADPEPIPNFTLANLEDDGDAFLIPDFESSDPVDGTEDAVKWVEKRWRMLFEHVLGEWLTDESLWPKKRTLIMFREWFSIEYRSMVWDLASEPLRVEDCEDDEDS